MINHHLHLNHKISQQKQWVNELLERLFWPLTVGTFAPASVLTLWTSPRLVRAMCCPVQSSDLKTHSWKPHALSQMTGFPFKLKIYRIEFKDSEINDNLWCVKVLQAPWLQLFCIQTASISNGLPCHSLHYTATLLLGPQHWRERLDGAPYEALMPQFSMEILDYIII